MKIEVTIGKRNRTVLITRGNCKCLPRMTDIPSPSPGQSLTGTDTSRACDRHTIAVRERRVKFVQLCVNCIAQKHGIFFLCDIIIELLKNQYTVIV